MWVNTKNPSWYCNNQPRRTTLESCTRGDTFKHRCHFPYPLPPLWDQFSKNPFNDHFHSSTSPAVTLQLFKRQYSPSSPNISTIKFSSPPHNPTAFFFFLKYLRYRWSLLVHSIRSHIICHLANWLTLFFLSECRTPNHDRKLSTGYTLQSGKGQGKTF